MRDGQQIRESADIQYAPIAPEKMAPPMLHLASDAGGSVTGMRFVAAKWESSVAVTDAIAASGAPAGWPDLARNPVWPGGGPKR